MKKEMKKKVGLFTLSKKAMKYVSGAVGDCCCACAYENQGGSSTVDNADANIDNDLRSPQCDE
jgi:hypothetical protein